MTVTAFNLPRTTRGAGVVLVLGLAAIHAAAAVGTGAPTYVTGLLLLACAGAAAAGVALLAGSRRVGWLLSLTVATACFAAYLASRATSWPEFAAAGWHTPLGTLALVVELVLGVLSLSLYAGTSTDVVGARDWQTYFSGPRPEHEGVLRG